LDEYDIGLLNKIMCVEKVHKNSTFVGWLSVHSFWGSDFLGFA